MIKKNKTLRAAGLLLALTLITCCFVGGTFAKYTTTASGTDSARVAYWGFKADADLGLDLFDGTYTNVDNGNEDNLLAPGTAKTDTIQFAYTNNINPALTAPEVAYNFTVDAAMAAGTDYAKLDANTSFYWTLQEDTGATTSYQTVADLIAAIKNLSGEADGTMEYAAGTLPLMVAHTYTIGWVWDFEKYTQCTDSDTFDADEDYYTCAASVYTLAEIDADTFNGNKTNYYTCNDATDTAMGNMTSDLDNVDLTITVSATQID